MLTEPVGVIILSFLAKVLASSSISEKTMKYLSSYINQDDFEEYDEIVSKPVPSDIKEELESFKMLKPTLLYRGLYWPSAEDYLKSPNRLTETIPKKGVNVSYSHSSISSWTTDQALAEAFSRNADFGFVLSARVEPEVTLVDTSNLPEEGFEEFRYNQDNPEFEVILLPCKISTKVVYVHDQRS